MELVKNDEDELDKEKKERHYLAGNRWRKKHHYYYYENETHWVFAKTYRFCNKHLRRKDYGKTTRRKPQIIMQ